MNLVTAGKYLFDWRPPRLVDGAPGKRICVSLRRVQGLFLLTTEAPIARIKLTGTGDEVKIAYWSHRRKWEDIDDMGGCVLPLDQALSHIATSSLF